MKKILIALAIFIAVIALLPIIGNNVAEGVLKDRVSVLISNGIELKNTATDSSYLNTKKHYEFLLSDAPKFTKYLNQYADAQIPSYVDAMLEGVVVGMDIEYSNFPLSSKVLVDIYPLTLPTAMAKDLKDEDPKFYIFVDKFLQARGILYHINYYISDELFDGYIKDIDEEYFFDNGSKLTAKLSKATYYGAGSLIAPKNLQTSIEKLLFKATDDKENLVFELLDMTSASTFESLSTYASSASMKAMNISLKEDASVKLEANLENFKVNLSSNTQGKKAQFNIASSLSEFKIKSNEIDIDAKDFNYNISLDDVDKDSYEEFRKLTSHTDASNTASFEKELQTVVVKLLSKGLSLRVSDISLDKIVYNQKESIDGFSFMARMTLNEDATLVQSLKASPKKVVENINLASTLTLSKEFYAFIAKTAPVVNMASSFAKEKDNKLIFEIKLNAGVLSINDKMIN
nr:hypothetical protein [uncultured Sulfurimonas sp.]